MQRAWGVCVCVCVWKGGGGSAPCRCPLCDCNRHWACCTTLATAVATRRQPSRHGEALAVERFLWRRYRRHGDTHRHLAAPIAMATPIAIWRHPSPFGDRRRQGETVAVATAVAVPRRLSPSHDSCRATARHLVVQCKLSRPTCRRSATVATAILAATAVAKVVQQAQYYPVHAYISDQT